MASETARSNADHAAGRPTRVESDPLWCPSARPDDSSVVFAVRVADPARAGVRYLDRVVPTTAELLALADPIDPREVFRFGAPCVEHACAHFDGSRCTLVRRLVEATPPAVTRLPPCRLRPKCRWFAEEGVSACHRCPVILTLQHSPDPRVAVAAQPPPTGSIEVAAVSDASVAESA